jgi:predicted MFS family arabinose efflux permease
VHVATGSVRDVVAEGARDRSYRARVLLLLALVLALDYADRSSVGALGPDLKKTFHISNTELGLLASAFSVVGAAATLPAGILTDRTHRTFVLAAAVALWGVAMGVTGAASSFAVLVSARIFLGAVTATARPAILSITGDTFPAAVRGRALGIVGSGEIVGNGIGFLVAGAVAALFSWRGVFWTLGAAGFGLVYLLWRLPEPPRGGGERPAADDEGGDAAAVAAEADDVEPDARLVLHGDQARRSFADSLRYVISVRTQVLVVAAVAIGSFFFAGLRSFIIVFAVNAYGVDRSVADVALLVAGIGGIVGILAGGRIGDALIARGRVNGRLLVASYSYLGAAIVLAPAFLLPSLWLALPLYVVGAAALSAPIPPLDAVRLDVIHPQLWGRAEAIRTTLLIVAEAAAPLLFGFVADELGGDGTGLRWAFLITLSTLVASAAILQFARRFYPPELAAAAASRRAG